MKWFIFGKREAILGFIAVLIVALVSYLVPQGVKAVVTQADERKLPIYNVQTQDKNIAITFDAAWGNSDTDELIAILKKHNAKATFFFTGQWVSKYPDDVRKFYAEGHEMGNHSDSHFHIKGKTAEQLRADILVCNEKIKNTVGKAPTVYRGPYGEYNNTLLSEVEKLKMYAVQWNIDSRDWQKRSVTDMISSVTQNATNGSIILFHNDVENTPAALDKILEILTKEGYSFITVSDLIYKDNYFLDSAGTQHLKNE